MSALEETLELLEWPRLCEHLSSFASTLQGRRHCCLGSLPDSLPESLVLQARTQEMASLDGLLDGVDQHQTLWVVALPQSLQTLTVGRMTVHVSCRNTAHGQVKGHS